MNGAYSIFCGRLLIIIIEKSVQFYADCYFAAKQKK